MTLIFGGTSEGRVLAEQALARGEQVVLCVTSEYGKSLAPAGAIVYAQPMDAHEMERVARRHGARELIDATHPFAAVASENIRECADRMGIAYRRVARPGDEHSEFSAYVTWAADARTAAALLAKESGPVLLTTGSNTLKAYADAIDPKRLYARVLPSVRSIELCEAAGIPRGHIIAMQGPFSEALNGALYDQFAIRHVVSKDSGDAGGVREKVLPALERDLNVILISRPEE